MNSDCRTVKDASPDIPEFIIFLATLEKKFLQIEIFAEACPKFCKVTRTINPWQEKCRLLPDFDPKPCVAISFYMDADLHKPLDPGKEGIGLSLLLRHVEGIWYAEADIDWNGKDGGASFDKDTTREAQSASIEEIMKLMPSLVDWLDKRFKEEITKL